ncbi:MAG: fatty acid--CoA ligase family protein [Candidatus Dormibacteraceae bacterium]
MAANSDKEAIVWRSRSFSYRWLDENWRLWRSRLESEGLRNQAVVVLEADFSPVAIAALLALVELGCVVVPLVRSSRTDRSEIYRIAQAQHRLRILETDEWELDSLPGNPTHPHYEPLRDRGHPGLVLFSSGTSGQPKGAVHDVVPLLSKFATRRPAWRIVAFLLFDHIGGINTILHTLSNGATLITVEDRSPDAVCAVIERTRAEVLPASPTFLRLLLLSSAQERFDLSSLKVVNYGTEPMSETTLKWLRNAFPNAQLVQSYGLAEVGILRSKSKSDDSTWVKVGGEGVETRVVDSILQIRSRSTMLGYLNAPSPITEDGWFVTGDAVEVDGDYLRILGRKSELINVGGEKVYPAEVEEVIEAMSNVVAATVYGEPNPLMGSIVCARVALIEPEEESKFAIRLKRHCRELLPAYQVPVKVAVVGREMLGERFKKLRKN